MDAEKIITGKITNALNNADKLSREALQDVYREALNYGAGLTPDKRGAFLSEEQT